MMRIIGDPPDRKITQLYAVIAIDKKTGLEGICSIGSPLPMQAVTSNFKIAEMILKDISKLTEAMDYEIKIRKFIPEMVAK